MSISKCIVRLKDAHNTEHTATVYAESLYEAAIKGLRLLENVGWSPTATRRSSMLKSRFITSRQTRRGRAPAAEMGERQINVDISGAEHEERKIEEFARHQAKIIRKRRKQVPMIGKHLLLGDPSSEATTKTD